MERSNPLSAHITLPSLPEAQSRLQRRFLRATAIATVVALAACGAAATKSLWRSNLAAQELSTASGVASAPNGDIYHLYTHSNQLYVRRLNPTGALLWASSAGPITSNITAPLLAPRADGAFLTTGPTTLASVSDEGAVQGNYSVAPTGAQIQKLKTRANGNAVAAYTSSGSNAGVAEFNAQGEERWRHAIANTNRLSLAELDNGTLLVVTTNDSSYVARFHFFDATGNLVQERDMPVESRYISLLHRDGALFIEHGSELTRLDNDGNTLWSQTIEGGMTSCTPGDNGEAACWNDSYPIILPPGGGIGPETITWLDNAGNVKHRVEINDVLSVFKVIQTLHYSGNNRWTVQRNVSSPLNMLDPNAPRKFSHYSQFSVLSDQGMILKTITTQPATYEESGGYTTEGDEVLGSAVTAGRLYVGGTTRRSRQGFVSAYTLP